MMNETRYYIFRVNGIDGAVTEKAEKAKEIYYTLKSSKMLKEEKAEVNSMTTTYNFSTI